MILHHLNRISAHDSRNTYLSLNSIDRLTNNDMVGTVRLVYKRFSDRNKQSINAFILTKSIKTIGVLLFPNPCWAAANGEPNAPITKQTRRNFSIFLQHKIIIFTNFYGMQGIVGTIYNCKDFLQRIENM